MYETPEDPGLLDPAALQEQETLAGASFGNPADGSADVENEGAQNDQSSSGGSGNVGGAGNDVNAAVKPDVEGGGEFIEREGIKVYIIQGEVCDLLPDIAGEPMRLEVKDTLEVLWDEDVHPRSQLKALLDTGKEISQDLYDNGSFFRYVFELIGSFKDQDNPSGIPEQLLDNETKKVLWQSKEVDADATYRTLTKNARILGHNLTSLRELYELKGQVLEAVTPEYGAPPTKLLVQSSRVVYWIATEAEAESKLETILSTAAPLGAEAESKLETILSTAAPLGAEAESKLETILGTAAPLGWDAVPEFIEATPKPHEEHTTLDMLDWAVERKEKLLVVFTFVGHGAHAMFGTKLAAAVGKFAVPNKANTYLEVTLKAPDEDTRNEWYKNLRAAHQWAVHQAPDDDTRNEWYKSLRAAHHWVVHQHKEMKRWAQLAAEFSSMGKSADGLAPPLAAEFSSMGKSADGLAPPIMGDILKITEDQMDAYRKEIIMLFDHSWGIKGEGTSKAKVARMEDFQTGIKRDIARAVGYNEELIRVTKDFQTGVKRDIARAVGFNEELIRVTKDFQTGIKKDIASAVGYDEELIRVTKVLKGNTKASWAEVGKENADFYLSLAKKCKQGSVLVLLVLDPDTKALDFLLQARERTPKPDGRS
ncbi:hypothetical protein T484DRAFT_1838451 [Baffinella frigidus]|nr:hypothetical protein T484DRAFT_1838451 [Cryptophyta sp. CCMP2293]